MHLYGGRAGIRLFAGHRLIAVMSKQKKLQMCLKPLAIAKKILYNKLI